MHEYGTPLAPEMVVKLFRIFSLAFAYLAIVGCERGNVIGQVAHDESTTISWEIAGVNARTTREFTEAPGKCFQFYGTISSQSILFSDSSSTGTLNTDCSGTKQKPLSEKILRSQGSWDKDRNSGPKQLAQVWVHFYKDTTNRKSEILTFSRASALTDFEQMSMHFSGVCQAPDEPGAYLAQLVLLSSLDEGQIYEDVSYTPTVIDEVKFIIK